MNERDGNGGHDDIQLGGPSTGDALIEAIDGFIASAIAFDKSQAQLWDIPADYPNRSKLIIDYNTPYELFLVTLASDYLSEQLDMSPKWFLQMEYDDTGENIIRNIRGLAAKLLLLLSHVTALGNPNSSRSKIEGLQQEKSIYRDGFGQIVKGLISIRKQLKETMRPERHLSESQSSNVRKDSQNAESIALHLANLLDELSVTVKAIKAAWQPHMTDIMAHNAEYLLKLSPSQQKSFRSLRRIYAAIDSAMRQGDAWFWKIWGLEGSQKIKSEISSTRLSLITDLLSVESSKDSELKLKQLYDIAHTIRNAVQQGHPTIIKKGHEVWEFYYYNTKAMVSTKYTGLLLIEELLRHPNKEYYPLELLKEVKLRPPEEEESAETVFDKAGLKLGLQVLEKKKAEYEQAEDPAERAEIKEEIEKLQIALNKSTDRFHKPRLLTEAHRKSVENLIKRAENVIKKQSSELYSHLKCIHTGNVVSYTPDKTTVWHIS